MEELFIVGYEDQKTGEFSPTGIRHWTLKGASRELKRKGFPYEIRFHGVTLLHATSDQEGYALTNFREKND